MAAEANRRAQQRQSQWLETAVATLEGSRCGSPAAPGVAMGIFNSEEYFENFPLPGSEEAVREGTAAASGGAGTFVVSTPRLIPLAASGNTSTPALPTAGSFASIAATSPQSDGFFVISSAMGGRVGTSYNGPIANSNAFELSFDDLPVTTTTAVALASPSSSATTNSASPPLVSPPAASSASKKGKRVLLVSNVQRRLS